MKKLFVLISDGGVVRPIAQFTFNQEFIDRQEQAYDNDELDYDSLGCDGDELDYDSLGCYGDGFHYETLTVPDECTLESLGIHYDCARD